MTDAEKALAYDDLITRIVAALQAQGYGTPTYRSYDDLKAEVADLTAKLAACEAKLPDPEPEPEPTPNWRTIRTIKGVGDATKLIEGFRNATLTSVTHQGRECVRFWIPGPQDVGSGRCEWQVAPAGKEGDVLAYEWSFYLPSHVKLTTVGDDENLIQQGHGNQKAGFTSGTSIDATTGKIKVKVKGGHETSTAGSHRYESEREFVFGTVQRDRWIKVRHEVHWHRASGSYRARLDDGPWSGLTGVPTWPLGDKDGTPTEHIMLRLGLYPSQGVIPGATGMELFTTPMVIQEDE